MKISSYVRDRLIRVVASFFVSAAIISTTGCGEVDGGSVRNTVELPTDSTLNFYCEDEGVFEETCVLDNPDNPYANVAVSEDNKFALNDEAPSAKSRYYLWATALAKGAGIPGENQFYTAVALHQVYAESGSPTTRGQALKAYRSALDNYFLAPTYFVFDVAGEEVSIAALVRNLVGENLYQPTDPNLISLYNDPAFALQDMSEWGYVYDATNKTVSILN